MNLDIYDNCEHNSEIQLQVQYFAIYDEEQELKSSIISTKHKFDTITEIENKLRNHIQEELISTTFKTPIDFLKEQMQNKIDNIFTFRQIQIFTNLSLLKEFGRARSIHYHQDSLILGGNLGNLLLLNQTTEIVKQSQKYGSISAIDANDQYIIIGYENGSMNIVQKNKIVENCNQIHTTKIIAIKFIFQNKKNHFSSFSSDIDGHTRITHFNKNMLGFDYNLQLALPKQQYPILSICCLDKTQSKRFIPNDKKFRVVLMCSLAKLMALQIYKDRDVKLKSLLEIENPHFSSPERPFYATVNFGYGTLYTHIKITTDKDIDIDIEENNNNNNNNNNNKIVNDNDNDNQQIIMQAWNGHVFFIIRENNTFKALKPLIFPKMQIHFVQFIGDSIIQLVTQNQTIYFFSTKELDLTVRPKNIDQIHHQQQKRNWTENLLTSIYSVENIDQEGNLQQKSYPLCLQAYAYSQNKLYLLTENNVLGGEINNFEQTVDIYIQSRDWSKAMYLVLSLMDGSLKYSPIKYNQESLQRKVLEIATHYIKIVIEQAKSTITNYKTIRYSNGMSQLHKIEIDKIKSFYSLLIDFLLRTMNKILFNQIYQILKKFLNGDISLFCDELKIFLKNDKVLNVETDGNTIIEIIEYYISTNEFKCIDKLIFNLNMNQSQSEEIISFCLKNKLTKSLSYICTNSGDFLTPLAKLWGIIQIEMKNNPKQVIEQGNNILLYLDSTLDNSRFKKETQDQISLWLFEQQTLIQLMSIDLIRSFQIIYKFFVQEQLSSNRLQKYCINVVSSMSQLLQIKDHQIWQLIALQIKKNNILYWEKLVNQMNYTFQGLMILQNYILVPQMKEYQQLLINLMLNSQYLLHLPLNILKLPEITNNDEPTLNYCLSYGYNQIIINLLKKFPDIVIDEEELINCAVQGNFDLIQLYLAEKGENYNRALDIKIRISNFTKALNIKTSKGIFKWIEYILSKITNNINYLNNFKERLLHHIGSLVSISATQTRYIISKYFQASDISILDKLNDLPNLQLDYIQTILQVDRSTYQQNTELLKLYIKLLCQLKPQLVLEELQTHDYPLDEIILICKQFQVSDALVFLLERSGAILEAVKIKTYDFKQQIMAKKFKNRTQFLYEFNEICVMCVRNAQLDETDECWDLVASELVLISNDRLTPQPFGAYVDDAIPIFFKKWAECSNLDIFLNKITTKYIKLSSLKLKKTFIFLYAHIFFQEIVFQKIFDINHIKCVENYARLVRVNHRGQCFFAGCYLCMQTIPEDSPPECLVVMACGHLFHLKCLQLDEKNLYHCPICLNNSTVFLMQLLHSLKIKKQKLNDNPKNQIATILSIIVKEGLIKQTQLQKRETIEQNQKQQKQFEKLRQQDLITTQKAQQICVDVKYI